MRIASLTAALCLALAATAAIPSAASALPQAAAAVPSGIQPTHIELAGANDRAIDVSVWTAPEERAVVVFSHGFGGQPEAYQTLLSRWAEAGFTVVAPLHVDSLAHPHRADYDRRAGFVTRIEDLAVVRGFVAAAHPGKPLAVAGHSFGSFMSMLEAGAATPVGAWGDADVTAVIGLSSAGRLPNLVTPRTYRTVAAPTLIITGDADVVPGVVTDWRDHRAPFDESPPGGKMLAVFAGGDHSLVRDADAKDFAFIAALTIDFLKAHALDDAEAATRLDALQAPSGVTLERR